MLIEDGKGSGQYAGVVENRLDVNSKQAPRITYVATEQGLSFTWEHSYNYDAGDTILLLTNTAPDKELHIHQVIVAADVATQMILHSPEFPTLAGTLVTGVNTKRNSGNVADALAYGDETGNVQANILASALIPAGGSITVDMQGAVILGYRDCIAVDLVTVGTLGIVTITGYFEPLV